MIPKDISRGESHAAPPSPSIAKVRPATNHQPEATLVKQIEKINEWAARNSHDADIENIKSWSLKAPAIACAAACAILGWINDETAIVLLCIICAICILSDISNPNRQLCNIHRRAEHDLLALSNEIDLEIDRIKASYPPLSDKQVAQKIDTILRAVAAERDRIGTYLRIVETAHDPQASAPHDLKRNNKMASTELKANQPRRVTPSLEPQDLARELTDTLARLITEPKSAKLLAERASFPSEHIPSFESATQFWQEVVTLSINGKADVRLLSKEAAMQFPHNVDLHDLLTRFEGLQNPRHTRPD